MKKRILTVASMVLILVMLFSVTACSGKSDETVFAEYKTERCEYLDTLEENKHAISLVIMKGKNQIIALTWDGGKSLADNKAAVDAVVDDTEAQIFDILSPEMDLSKYLEPDGALKFNGVVAAKADYQSKTNAEVEFTEAVQSKISALSDAALKSELLAVKKVQEMYTSSVVSFASERRVIITTHYTELGARYLTACGTSVQAGEAVVTKGTYAIVSRAEPRTTLCPINVTIGENTSAMFYIDAEDGKVYRNDMFEKEEMPAVSAIDVILNSGIGVVNVTWQDGTDGTSYKNVVYGDRERNVLDLYVPKNLDTSRENGVLLFVHGGSWVEGDKADMENMCVRFAKEGYITATLSYSYVDPENPDPAKQHTLLTIDDDLNRAMTKIKEMSDANDWNITKSALYGFSAGCHIAYLYAYGQGNEKTAPLPVVFASGMVGCLDFRDEYWENVGMVGSAIAAAGLNDMKLIDGSYSAEEYNRLIDTISPLSFAKKGDAVPSIIAFGELDALLIDYIFASVLEETLDEFDIDNYCVIFANSDHAMGNNPEQSRQFKAQMDKYLQLYFGY